MADATQKNEPPVRCKGALANRPVRLRTACNGALLLLALVISAPSQTTDSYSTVIQNHLALEAETPTDANNLPIIKFEDPQLGELKHAVLAEARALPQAPYVAPPPPVGSTSLVLALTFPLLGLGAAGGVGYLVKRRLDVLNSKQAVTNERLDALLAEDKSLVRFFHELREGLNAPASDGDPLRSDRSERAASKTNPLEDYFAAAPARIARLRAGFSEISRAADDAARQNILTDFAQQASVLKDGSRLPELRPVWLLASALEGLLRQLSNNPAEITPSVLGTAAAAVDLLETLSVPGLNPNLATEPPVQLLAVDDDAVSRLAVSFALKKAFNPPDLAPDGETALGLIARQTYDVIFLDVDMPGMDGYELCTRIHQTEQHRTTPVVFVTRHGDFNSRAKSTLSGGEDLIAKPFLAFEITVKALTLALRGRLATRKTKPKTSVPAQEAKNAIAATTSELAAATSPGTVLPPEPQLNGKENHSPAATSGGPPVNGKDSRVLSDRGFQALFKPPGDDSPEAFFHYAPAHLEELRNQLQAAQHSADPAELQKFLGQLYVGVHSLGSEAERAEQRTISKLTSALEGMLKKLLEHTNFITPSTLNATAAALELLEELCGQTRTDPDLAQPPVRILVVDDDPVARRGISSSLQLVFGRPDDAGSGEAALALAAEKPYDLIFLDVLMPGIDGFTACSRIHKTDVNRRTPVVFVTSHDDMEARSKAVVSGGCGFIPKPVLASQIKLTALTFILRARLPRSGAPTPLEEATCLETA